MDPLLEIGRVFLYEIPESRLPLWSMEVQTAVLIATEAEEQKHKRFRKRGKRAGRRMRNAVPPQRTIWSCIATFEKKAM